MNFFNRFKYARDSYFLTLLIIGIIAMIAFLSERHFVRIDLTEDQEYAISDSTREAVSTLDDIVTVKVFFSEKLPPNLFTVRQYVQDLLEELTSYSHKNLQVQFPSLERKEVQEEAKLLGVPMVRMNIFEKDKFEVKNGFLGIALSYGGRHELLPIVQDTLNLEYDLVSAIRKLISPHKRQVAFTTGHNEYPINRRQGESYFRLRTELLKNYEVTEVDLTEESALAEVHTLIIGGPQESFSDAEVEVLEGFLKTGKTVLLLLDGVQVTETLSADVVDLNLGEFLANYGVTVEPHFVLDQSNATASFAQGYVNFIVPYPFWVKAIKEEFNQINPIMSKLDSVVLPWASPLTLKHESGVKSTVLAKTTDEAWLQESPFNLDPNLAAPTDVKRSQKDLIAMFETDDDGQLLVIGNSRLVTDRVIGQFEQNLNFFLNAVDFLTLDKSLIGIRSKVVSDRPLKELTDQERTLVKFGGIFLVPILVVVYGMLRFVYRKKKKFKLPKK